MLSTDKLKNKEVINISDGKSLGFVNDIEVDLERGTIGGIVIPVQRSVFGWFSRGENDMLIKWEKVKTVGDDVILVDLGPQDVV
ncbi:MAG: YlmC/YmxH family sporulation protein [Firmicutes bacterium]|nr:YlmC/YmxH family sporulation protein [Bacillota bacterium]